jgi:hypothetical protein
LNNEECNFQHEFGAPQDTQKVVKALEYIDILHLRGAYEKHDSVGLKNAEPTPNSPVRHGPKIMLQPISVLKFIPF